MFELELPMDIQKRIYDTEKNLWKELDHQNLHEEFQKDKEWILDLGHTMGRVSLRKNSGIVLDNEETGWKVFLGQK